MIGNRPTGHVRPGGVSKPCWREGLNLPHYKLRLQDVSRELYRTHEWDMPDGLRDPAERDPLNYSQVEAAQAKKAERDPAELKKLFRSCWEQSDSAAAFAHALRDHGFGLARGDRRGFVAVDADGKVYSLSRWVGVKPKELQARLGEPGYLLSIEDAVAALRSEPNRSPVENSTDADRRLATLESRRKDLVDRQRGERRDLRQAQAQRRADETNARQSRLPKSLAALWLKVSGGLEKLERELAAEAKACAARDRRETQALIERHLAERRGLQHEIEHLQAMAALEAELRRAPSGRPFGRDLDLSRFDAAPLIAFTATKETNYGHGKNG